jgi:hypothetical protein
MQPATLSPSLIPTEATKHEDKRTVVDVKHKLDEFSAVKKATASCTATLLHVPEHWPR